MSDQDAMKHPGGRPLLFKSAEELQARIDAYFADCDPHAVDITEWVQARSKKGDLLKDEHGLNYLVEVHHKILTEQKHYTITGLAVWLNTSRQTLINYEEKEEFFDTIKAAKDRIEHYTEQMLFTSSPTGAIFNLKNNYEWKDKTERDLTTNGKDLPTPILGGATIEGDDDDADTA